MKTKEKYYLGLTGDGRWDLFAADDPKDATPDETGYIEVEGAFDTKEEAQEVLDCK